MSVLSGRVGGLRMRLFKLVLASALTCALPAFAADAALAGNASMKPSVQGYGFVSAPGYSCANFNKDDRSIVNSCGTTTAIAPFLGNAVLTMTATPFSNNGNQFSRWENCALPFGAIGDVSLIGNTCTLSVNFIFGDVLMTPRAVFDDVAGPTVSSLSPIYSTSVDRSVTFTGATNEDISGALECSVDGGAFAACGALRTLTEGTHQVRARAFDVSGNLGAATANQNFRIIDTALVSGPADFSSVKRPSFTYSTLAGLNFECSMDGGAFQACGTKDPGTNRASFAQPTDLADGLHAFRVRALDGPDFDRVPIVRTWRVDTTAPVINNLASPTITDGVVTTGLNATFTWAVTEVGGLDRFECKLDDGAFAACASGKTYNDLPFGGHTFTVRGIDKAGNVGTTVSRSWTVAARDEDGDGFNQRSDCDDANPAVNPIATDVPDNGVDENCDGADAINLDRDGDGFQRPADCNDDNPNIKPGVTDVPENGVDENCDGSDATKPRLPRIASTVSFNFPSPGKKSTKFTVFLVKNVPAGSTLTAVCKGKACGKKSIKQTVKKAKGTVRLKTFQRVFKVGSTIEVRVSKPGMEGIVKLVKVQKKKNPTIGTKCLSGSRVVTCA